MCTNLYSSHHSNGALKLLQIFKHGCTHFNLQATLSDKAVGSLLILTALTIFLYYTIWVVVLVSHSRLYHMTVDDDNIIHN